MLVPSLYHSSSSEPEPLSDEIVPGGSEVYRAPARFRFILRKDGRDDLRDLLGQTEGVELKGHVFARIAYLILRDRMMQRTYETINELGLSLLKVSRYIRSSAGSKAVGLVLLHDWVKGYTPCITTVSQVLRQYFACLKVIVGMYECRRDELEDHSKCQVHGGDCQSTNCWLSLSQSLFTSPDDLLKLEHEAQTIAKIHTPILPEDMEYFAETCLTPRKERCMQMVPGSCLHHFESCFYQQNDCEDVY